MPRNPQVVARDRIARKQRAWENAKALVAKTRSELDEAIVEGVRVGITRHYIGKMLHVSGQAIGQIEGVPPGKNVVKPTKKVTSVAKATRKKAK